MWKVQTFCWIFLIFVVGANETENVTSSKNEGELMTTSALNVSTMSSFTTDSPNSASKTNEKQPEIYGIRVLRPDIGKSLIQQIQERFFHLIGKNLQLLNSGYVTTSGHCFAQDLNKHFIKLEPVFENDTKARSVTIEKQLKKNKIYHFCADDLGNQEYLFSYRQFVKLESESKDAKLYFPLFIQISLVAILAVSSALFSGLNIGLMSLSVSSLELIIKHDERQRQYAQNILPLRKNGNLLLCTILIGNTFVNNCQTLLLSNLFSSLQLDTPMMMLLSIITPSCIIVIIGEIVPQALCCRYGLIVGSKTRYITIFLIVMTFVVSYPLSKILDWLIGVEGPESFDKEMLTHIVEMNAEAGKGLSKATANLLVRALKYNEKVTVRRIMTPIEKVFMLSESAVVDTELLKKIHNLGHTRIPIHKEGNKNMICAIINVKDLVPIDPKCQLRIGTVVQVWQRSRHFRFVLEDFPISQLLKEMKRGQPLALVVRFNESTKDYDVTGVIALEDIVEEITGEILDEKDVKRTPKIQEKFIDNK